MDSGVVSGSGPFVLSGGGLSGRNPFKSMKIGLTGGIACGKSEVLRMFAQAGWRTLSADTLVHGLLDGDPGVADTIVAEMGPGMVAEDGTLDKRAIGRAVFAESARRAWLEALLHPRVREAWTSAIAEDPGADWVVEIPLLFEKKLETGFDLVVCLSSSLNNQLSRLRLRGLSEVDAMARISSQAPLAEKIEKSDIVLTNNGSLEFLQKQFHILLGGLA